MKKIIREPLIRDDEGAFINESYRQQFHKFDDMDYIPMNEFNDVMASNGLKWRIAYANDSEWEFSLKDWPTPPICDGWFVLAIDDSEDGYFCLMATNADKLDD